MKFIIIILIVSIIGICTKTDRNLLVTLAKINEYIQLNDYLTTQIGLCKQKFSNFQTTSSEIDLEALRNSIQYYLR